MKELLSVQDYLLQVDEVGDWDGEEELVADRLNSIFHAVWDALPEDIDSATIEQLYPLLWNELRGGTVLVEADEDELIDWALSFVDTQLEDGMLPAEADDDEQE